MAILSITNLMSRIAATVNQDATAAPSNGSTEWTLWLNFINRAISEWAQSNDWEETVKVYYPPITGTTQATISLPADFRALADFPRLWDGSIATGHTFPVILRDDVGLYDAQTNWVYPLGDNSNGQYLVWNPGTLASGASISIPYFSIPTSLASPSQTPILPDDGYLIDRVIAYIFEARSDPRFQEQEAKSREKLLQMIENHDVKKYNSFGGQTPVHNTTRLQGMRWGRD